MIKAIIIDDEISGIATLKFLIESYYSERVDIIETASNLKEAVDKVRKSKPDLIFLDMEMPGEFGYQLKEMVDLKNIAVIITTAHKNYGIESLKMGAIDYLLKPIDPDDLEKTLAMVEDKINEYRRNNILIEIVNNNLIEKTVEKRIPLYISSGRTIFVLPSQLLYCKAEGNYTNVVLIDGTRYLVTKQLNEIIELLENTIFFRPHKSYCVNLNYISAYNRGDEIMELVDKTQIPLSRNMKASFLEIMKLNT